MSLTAHGGIQEDQNDIDVPTVTITEEDVPTSSSETIRTSVSLIGDTFANEKSPVEYTVSIANVDKLSTVTVWIEVDGSFVEGTAFLGLNGFQIIDEIEWVNKGGDIWGARITLLNLGGSVTSIVPVDILSVGLTTRDKPGKSEIKITDAKLSGFNDSSQEDYIDFDLVGNMIELEVRLAFSIYDINKDGIVDQLDLTLAQLYFASKEGDDDWDTATCADVNADGVVDVADFILISGGIFW